MPPRSNLSILLNVIQFRKCHHGVIIETASILHLQWATTGAHNRSGGKMRESPTHLIELARFPHDGRVTKVRCVILFRKCHHVQIIQTASILHVQWAYSTTNECTFDSRLDTVTCSSGVGTKFTLGVQKGVWSIVFMTLVSSLY